MPIFVAMVPLSNICKNTDVQQNNMLIAKNLNNIIVILYLLLPPCELRWFPHNIQAIMTKIKLPKNPLSMVIKVRRSYRDLSPQADPAREN